jgi:phage terminase large subunit
MRTRPRLATIKIPNDWHPRPHQRKCWDYFERGGKRAAVVWHRRAGKDSMAINLMATKAIERVGVYWHMLPEATQGRKVIWDGIDKFGRRIIDQAFPKEIRKRISDNEMKIELFNGSIFQVVGSDNYNSLVGSNPVGINFSEWSIAKPSAWDYMRPILAENGGWALFIYTPRGNNHGKDTYDMAMANPDWFSEILTVDDTKILPDGLIDEERASGMDDALIEQEYYCSFAGARVGSYYGAIINQLERDGRIGGVLYDPNLLVHTFWDIGYSDDTTIWFVQIHKGTLRVIDCYSSHGKDVQHYADVLRAKCYRYAEWHWLPHDARAKTLAANGRSTEQQLTAFGYRVRIAPSLSVQDGIQAVRATLPLCRFDRVNTKDGLAALKQYQRRWSDDMRAFQDRPLRDWSSHYADAFRMLAVSWKQEFEPKPPPPPKYENQLTFNEIRERATRRRLNEDRA